MFILSIILAKTNFTQIALGTLYVSIIIIILYLVYQKVLTRINRKEPNKALYCDLIYLENDVVSGVVEFYFTNIEVKDIRFEILDKKFETVSVLAEQKFETGQHIARFDSTSVPNGAYFYQLKTENQQTMRQMFVKN